MFTIEQLPSLLGWFFGVVPLLGKCYWVWLSRGEPWRVSVLVSGVLMVLLAVHMTNLFIDLIAFVDALPEAKRQQGSVWAALRSSGATWLAAFPVLAAGVVTNLIATWLVARKSHHG